MKHRIRLADGPYQQRYQVHEPKQSSNLIQVQQAKVFPSQVPAGQVDGAADKVSDRAL